jgi:hypothetical protein
VQTKQACNSRATATPAAAEPSSKASKSANGMRRCQ